MDADVVVVGAGPAGSTAACDLAQRGFEVLLVDRESFPRDKTCGDGVPPGSVEILNALGMAEKIRAAGFYPIRGIRLGSPAGRTWETSFRPKRDGVQFYVAPRRDFDAIIREHAIQSGARFVQADVRGLVEENGRVAGVRVKSGGGNGTLGARLVIGADGAASAVARALKARRKLPDRRRAVAIRGYMDGVETLPNRVEFYYYRRLVPGYGWVFPLGPRRANVGVIMRVDRLRRAGVPLETLLDEFLASPALRGRVSTGHHIDNLRTWQLPCAPDRPGPNAFDGALLVGDAAALVDPLTGEGVHNALVSARIAAEVAAAALGTGDTSLAALSVYDRRCGEALGRVLRRSRRIHYWLALAPWWVDAVFALANAAPERFRLFLNRRSTDFVLEP